MQARLTSRNTPATACLTLHLAIESLDRPSQPVTHSAVDALTGVGWDRVLAAMRAWAAETGKTRVRCRSWSPVTLDMVLPLIDPALHHLPLTFLDEVRQGSRDPPSRHPVALFGLRAKAAGDCRRARHSRQHDPSKAGNDKNMCPG